MNNSFGYFAVDGIGCDTSHVIASECSEKKMQTHQTI
jgi:hypothetical protein